MAAIPPMQYQQPKSKVEISVTCANLADKDVMSKSDPMCVLFVQPLGSSMFSEFGRTEVVKNTLDPAFAHKFVIDYLFEEVQKLRFEIHDVDSPSEALKRQDFLGYCECTLGEVVGSPGSSLSRKLVEGKTGKSSSVITISIEEVSSCRDAVTVQFRAEKLDKKDFFGKSDPFLTFHRANENNTWTLCHRTEHVNNTLNPTWRPFTIPATTLCNGDYDRAIRVECYDYDDDGSSHDLIGAFQTTLTELVKGPGSHNTYECINQKKKSHKKNYRNSGSVMLMTCKIEKLHTFLDYIRGGTQLHFTVAIDFTASNGNPQEQTSLHYMNPYQPNQYVQAIQAVGSIIENYDSDKLFPVLGFGAKVPPQFNVSHEFFVNLHPSNPYCQGVAGIVQAYQQSLLSVQLYGPTNFSPVINHVARIASAVTDGSQYFILLIITDGVITDMTQTKLAIIQGSSLPLSIIIIGVGEADFSAMEELDSDKQKLIQGNYRAERDIVQFVPFNEYQMSPFANKDMQFIQQRLAKDVLAEVPNQLVSYMRSRNIQPRAPVNLNVVDVPS